MICCYDLFVAWFCSYDIDMVSFMIWVQNVISVFFCVALFSKNVSNTYQNHIRNTTSPKDRIKTVSKSYQHHDKTPFGLVWYGRYVYVYIYRFMVPHFVCPLNAMNDEPICTLYAENFTILQSFLDFVKTLWIQVSPTDFPHQDLRLGIQKVFLRILNLKSQTLQT